MKTFTLKFKHLFSLLFLIVLNSSAQDTGCMSDWADNYDSLAIEDDGSCFRMGCTTEWAFNFDPLRLLMMVLVFHI